VHYIFKPKNCFLFNLKLNCFKTSKAMSYKKLEIWELARELSIEIHKMTMQLPAFEMYEEGRQIQKSIKTVRSTIVEGYGRKRYKQDFIKFIVYALSSNDETIDHLDGLFETGSLKDEELYKKLSGRLQKLGIKINNFLTSVENNHRSIK